MRIDIIGQPTFRFKLTVNQALIIQKCAINHYDMVCKKSGMVGGFVYGWAVQTSFETSFESPATVSATLRELDLICKILEAGSLLGFEEADELRCAFVFAMRQAIIASRTWTAGIETKEMPK